MFVVIVQATVISLYIVTAPSADIARQRVMNDYPIHDNIKQVDTIEVTEDYVNTVKRIAFFTGINPTLHKVRPDRENLS